MVRDHPDPEPGAGELLVRVRAAGLNGADLLQRLGLYPPPADSPDDIPGLELAGQVTATVRNESLHNDVAALGATVLGTDGWASEGPYDVILELVGGSNMSANLEALAVGGRITVIGVGAGATAELNLGVLMGRRGR